MNTNCYGKWAVLMICLAGLGAAGLAQGQPEPGTSTALVELNRAIKAYLEEDRDTAGATFERLVQEYPQAEFRITCQYYLGLIALERGLASSAAAQAAALQKATELAAQEATKAREQFEKAQGHFEQVVPAADPTAEMINAALLLGIAQLATDFPGAAEGDAEAAMRLAQRAEETLRRYVSETEPGAQDRYGHFYLAVAQYRLAEVYRDQPGRARDYAQSLAAARQGLNRALALGVADRDAGRLTPDAFESFKTVVTYYDALLAILERDNARARHSFTEVTERAAGTDLAVNAQTIIDKLDEVEMASPQPMRVPIPAPIGPWEVDGRVRIGTGFDNNIILLGKDTQLPRGFDTKEGYWFGLSADFNVSRHIPRTEAPWVGESLTIGMGGSVGNVWQPAVAEFDVNRYAGRAYVNWQPVRDFYLGFQYEYSYTLLGQDPFISSQRVTPVISKAWRGTTGQHAELVVGQTDLYYTHDDRNYLDVLTNRGFNRDGTYQAVGLRHTFNLLQAKELPYLTQYYATHERERQVFGDKWLSLYLGYECRAESTVGTEFSLGGNSMVWGLRVPLPYRLAFELDGEFAWSGYTGPSLLDYNRKERADFMQRYDFGFTYAIIARGEYAAMRTLDVKLRTGVELTFQDSNIWDRLGEDVYSYNRAIYGVQLEVGF